MYLDVVTALREAKDTGLSAFAPTEDCRRRYGLSSKEFTRRVKAVLTNWRAGAEEHFTVGIMDDVTHLSLPYNADLDIEPKDVHRGVFFGLGPTARWAEQELDQDHRRRNRQPRAGLLRVRLEEAARSRFRTSASAAQDPLSYLVKQAGSSLPPVRVHGQVRRAGLCAPGGVFLLNSPFGPDEVVDSWPRVQQEIIDKKLRFYVIDAFAVARDTGMARASTRSCRRASSAISGSCRATRPCADQEVDREDVRQARARSGPQELRRGRQTLEHLHQVQCGRRDRHARAAPSSRTRRRTSSSA